MFPRSILWPFFSTARSISSESASITRVHRNNYLQKYDTKLVLSDGATISIRYHEPRQIIKLPLDLSTLPEVEARRRLENRKPKTKIIIQEEEFQSFNRNKYINLIKKK